MEETETHTHGWRPCARPVLRCRYVDSPGQVNIRELPTPVWVMLRRICVRRFARSTVNGQVGLPIAVEVEPAHFNPSRKRLFEDTCGNRATLPGCLARKSGIDRDQLHSEPPHRLFLWHTHGPAP